MNGGGQSRRGVSLAKRQPGTWRWIGWALAVLGGVSAQAQQINSQATGNGHRPSPPKAAALGRPVVGRNADGYLEVFQVNGEGQLQHRWQKKTNGDWSDWATLGTGLEPGIAVVRNAAGELEIFAAAADSAELVTARQLTPNGTEWSAWTQLGGSIQGPVAAARNADGTVEIFARAASGETLMHRRQRAAGWSEWTSLGGELEPGFVLAANHDGRLEVFGVSPGSQALLHSWQRRRNSTDWSPWHALGGPVLPGIALGRNARGVLEVFAVNARDGELDRICQTAPGTSAEWKGWEDFGAKLQDGLAVGQSADGRLEVMGVSRTDRMLMHRWEILNNGSDRWSAWASLGKEAQPFPALGQNEDGNLEVFALDVNNGSTLNHRRQISRASDWLDWATMDHETLDYSTRTWQTDEGLPQNQVQAVAQTRDGYLWVGTPAGLARFDGLAFRTFDQRNTPELKNVSITALCADREGALWIGTDGGGLVRYEDGRFTHYGRAEGLAGDVLKVVYEGRDGALWVGTTSGMSCYKDGHFTTYTRKQGLSSDIVTDIFEDRDGYIWIATGAGLNRLKGEKMDAFPMPNGLPNDSVRVIWQDRAGRIWIGSNNGMLWYNAYWHSFYAYNTKYGLSDTFVSAICDDREGNLWVGTYSGLNRFRDGRFFPELNNEGQPFDRVNALVEDREGDLWVGSREGLSRLTPRRFVAYTKRQGLSHNNVTSVLQDEQGSVWLGTWGGGLDRLQDGDVTAYAATNALAQTLVLSLGEGHDGSLWIGADFDGGLTRYWRGAFTHYTWRDGLPNAAVRVIHEDSQTNLWLGTDAGLSCFRNGKFVTYTVKDGLAGNAIHAIEEQPDGTLWLGTESGLSEWKAGRFTNFSKRDGLPDDAVLALLGEPDGTLWIGTREGGLARWRGGRFTTYDSKQGLFSDEIFGIVDDQAGWLWMSCSKGIFRVRKGDLEAVDEGVAQEFSSVVYGKIDGLESTQCNGEGQPAAWRSVDGRLWFPTTKGVVTVQPRAAPINPMPPPVYIDQVWADRKEVWGGRLQDSEPTGPLLRVSPGRGELEFHFTALTLAAPESARFKYKLENVDSDWVDAGTRRVAHYNNIYPGTYRFEVLACSADGVWSPRSAALALVLEPHLWQTWWWRGALVFLVLGSATATGRYFTRRRLQQKLHLLEQRHAIEKERGRIAKDIHDDLGSSLTRIMMLGERAEEGLARNERVGDHVQKIVASARATVQAMDEIVWAVNPENDTLEGLVEYVSHYADEFFENSDVSCRLEIPVRLPDCMLPAEIRHDLFLTVKECFNNIAKHAHATELRVQLEAVRGRLRIEIQDNGCGFDPTAEPRGRKGNGLGNMSKRLETHGGAVQVEGAPGQGTKVTLTVALPQSPTA